MTIAVDFDGTITKKSAYPQVGEIADNCAKALNHLQARGHKIILWTCREGKELQDAIQLLANNEVYLQGYNKREAEAEYGNRKIIADMYIDDRAYPCDPINWEDIFYTLTGEELKNLPESPWQ